jgi:DNA polymerase III sliding clamp (beta) subunit (PCNA family)
MKIIVSISELKDALSVVSLTLSKRLGSADNALLYLRASNTATGGGLYLFSFDGIARTMVKIPAKVEEEGKTVINPTNLIGSLSKVIKDGEITLTQGEKKDALVVTGAGRKMKFAASGELDNFEALIGNMPLAQQETFVISAATFKNLIRQSAPFVDRPDKEEAKDLNRGDTNLLIHPVTEGYEACATEGNAMAVVKVKDINVSSQAESLKIPIRSVLNLKGMLEKMKGQHIRIIIGRDQDGDPSALYLRTENIFYGTSLDTARFRDYQKIIGMKVSHQVSLPKDHFQGIVANATPFTGGLKEDDQVTVLFIGRNKIKVTAGKGTETFEEEVDVSPSVWPANQEGALRLAFKPEYLANVARVISGNEVTVGIAENQVIAFFGSETDDIKSTYAVARYVDQIPVAKAA